MQGLIFRFVYKMVSYLSYPLFFKIIIEWLACFDWWSFSAFLIFLLRLLELYFFKTYLFKSNYILDRKKHKTHIPQVEHTFRTKGFDFF